MNFRRIITAMVLLACCVGLASAQVNVGGTGNNGPLTCTANAAVPPQLRSEGITEVIGDIVITCIGGNAPAVGPVPVANITVSLNTNITSRLLTGGAGFATGTSEALLFIDEPTTNTSGTGGAGPAAAFNYCNNTVVGAGTGGCTQTVNSNGTVTSASPATNVNAPTNVFQGIISTANTPNQVTFLGIPVLPPVTTGVARIYRITNIRANVSALASGGGGFGNQIPLQAFVSISGSNSLPLNAAVQTVGLIQQGLFSSVRSSTGGGPSVQALNQCVGSTSPVGMNILRYVEGFGSSFKTRVVPVTGGNGQGTGATQTVPGTIYPAESAIVLPTVAGTTGLADFGTRLKATFTNIPSTVRVFVSVGNIPSNTALSPIVPPTGTSTSSYAVLVTSETLPDSNGSAPVATANTTSGSLSLFELPVSSTGTATAVWEVINTNPNVIETFDFGFYQQFAPNPGSNTPPLSAPNVNTSVGMSFAPTGGGILASSTSPIPRFVDSSSATGLFNIVPCSTVLLYPYVVNVAGFDTGLAIANTTTDPFGTRAQNGTCTLNFYGSGAPTTAPVTPNVPTATVWANLTSTVAPGFAGYMIATCNFQLAHGFAFVSDLGSRNIAMGYLALVVPTGIGNRNQAAPEGLNQ